MIALQVSHDITRILQRGGIKCKLKYEFLQYLLGLLPALINVFGVHMLCKLSVAVLYILLCKSYTRRPPSENVSQYSRLQYI